MTADVKIKKMWLYVNALKALVVSVNIHTVDRLTRGRFTSISDAINNKIRLRAVIPANSADYALKYRGKKGNIYADIS